MECLAKIVAGVVSRIFAFYAPVVVPHLSLLEPSGWNVNNRRERLRCSNIKTIMMMMMMFIPLYHLLCYSLGYYILQELL